mgnify:CR=1 FL=1
MLESPGLQLGVLDRIEMVRGPGSAVYGADAFHGVLSLKTFASDRDLLEVESELGTDGYGQIAGRWSEELTDWLRINAAVAYNQRPDQDERYT